MKKADVYPAGKFLKTARDGSIDIAGNPLTVQGTIASMTTHEFDDGRSQRVIHFSEELPDLGLNVTNWNAIAAFTGKDDDDEWIGMRIEMFAVPETKSQTGQAIRVRRPRADAAPATRPAATSSNEPTASASTNAQLIRKDAWRAFQAARPGMSVDEITPAWRELCTSVGGGKDPKEFTAGDWTKVKSKAVPIEDPISDAEPILDDIPFSSAHR